MIELPSFSGQNAVVYDDYLRTMGGGERSALAYAAALAKLDFSVEIVSTQPLPCRSDIVQIFGSEFADIEMTRMLTDDVYSYLKRAELRVFVNHTFMDFTKNPAKIGIYAQMFPVSRINMREERQKACHLQSYNLMLCNSSFTKTYTTGLWEFPKEKVHVLHPPIGQKHVDAAKSRGAIHKKKRKQFVNIGRFNPGTHNKNQKIIIEAFLDARSRFPDLKDWSLTLIGNANQDEESHKYLESCKELAATKTGAVEIQNNIPEEQLIERLKESFGYVHATGAFHLPGENPFKCEHLGLSIIEAMAYGAIPIVYARGGIFDILEPGSMGIPYITYEGLVEGFRDVATLYGSAEAITMQSKNMAAASNEGLESFISRFADFLAREFAS
jgi:glycosyltransferase involved in cell wall biosynthesis